jgi:hypothetical protein
VRALVALIGHLPPDSAFSRATGGWWSDAHELAASQIELTHALLMLTARAYGSKARARPLRVPRPGDAAVPARTGMSMAGFFDALAAPG